MPSTSFESMPDSARVWVFAASRPLDTTARDRLFEVVDGFLSQWHAHGVPLTAARDLRDDRFLVIAVDESATGASGCSIDGIFRALQSLEGTIGTSMLNAGQLYWRGRTGAIESGTRQAFTAAARVGDVSMVSTVYDLTVSDAGAWRQRFAVPAAESWHRRLLAS